MKSFSFCIGTIYPRTVVLNLGSIEPPGVRWRCCHTDTHPKKRFRKEKSSERRKGARNSKLLTTLQFQINMPGALALRNMLLLTGARCAKSELPLPSLQFFICCTWVDNSSYNSVNPVFKDSQRLLTMYNNAYIDIWKIN